MMLRENDLHMLFLLTGRTSAIPRDALSTFSKVNELIKSAMQLSVAAAFHPLLQQQSFAASCTALENKLPLTETALRFHARWQLSVTQRRTPHLN